MNRKQEFPQYRSPRFSGQTIQFLPKTKIYPTRLQAMECKQINRLVWLVIGISIYWMILGFMIWSKNN